MTDECEFDPTIAEELAGRWAVLERLAATYGGDTRPLLLAIRDTRATELRLLQSARVETLSLADLLELARDAAAAAGWPQEAGDIEAMRASGFGVAAQVEAVEPKRHGPTGNPPGAPGKDGRAYTEAEKVDAVRLYATVGRNKAVEQTGVSKSTLTRWAQERPDLVKETKFDAEMEAREAEEEPEDTREAAPEPAEPLGPEALHELDRAIDAAFAPESPDVEAIERQRRHDAIRARSVEGAFTDGEL